MTPKGLTLKQAPTACLKPRPQSARSETSYVASLEADSHRPEIQEVISQAIRRGSIRVVPMPGCVTQVRVVRIVPEAIDDLPLQS